MKHLLSNKLLLLKDGKFVAVGTNDAILGNYSSDQVMDAKGKAIYPGFNDAHCHFYGYGTNLIKRADLVGTKSFDEVVERLKAHHQKYPTEWIEGRGWDQNDWEIKSFPTKEYYWMKPFPITRFFLSVLMVMPQSLIRKLLSWQK